MGGDGGTIQNRRDCLRINKDRKDDSMSRDMKRATKWLHCSLSQEPLSKPIVGCRLGRMYNKEKLIEYMLDKQGPVAPEAMSHIRSMKDVKTLNICDNGHKPDSFKFASWTTTPHFPFCCPIMGLEMNGVYKFSFLWNCGCLMAERAIRQLATSECPNCNKSFSSEEVIIVHAEGEDLELMTSRNEARVSVAGCEKRKRSKTTKSSLPIKKSNPEQTETGISSSTTSNKPVKPTSDKPGKTQPKTSEKNSAAFNSLFHKSGSKKLDPNRGFWSETTHSYYFAGTS
jgi:hypothetical protein